MAQTVFKRYELKYMLTHRQREMLQAAMAPYMTRDKFGRATVCSLYFDTENYRLIRRSIEKPVYKEKLRIRSYGQAQADGTVFVELKKKYRHVVYKRRLGLPETETMAWLTGDGPRRTQTQLEKEVSYFLDYYQTLRPALFLAYTREAFYAEDGSDFRVTFDDTVLCRQEELRLTSAVYGTPLLPEERVLMELKCSGGIPLWMTRLLSAERLYKTSFSKYGTAYQTMILPKRMEV